MKLLRRYAEPAFTILSLLHYTGGPLVVILSGGASEGDKVAPPDFALVRLIFLLIYAITFCLLAYRWKRSIYALTKDRFIWILITLAISSFLWSYAPSVTRTRIIALIGTTLFGLYLASRYSLKQQLRMVGLTFGLVVFLSILFIGGLPRYGIMGGVHAGAFRGIFSHKNVFGKMIVIAITVFGLMSTRSTQKRFPWLAGMGISFALLLLARSTSSLVNLMNLVMTFMTLNILRWRSEAMIAMLCATTAIGGCTTLWLQANLDRVLGTFGKDASLTGRGDMWPYILDKVWERPWLGYGYGAFWLGANSEAAYVWRAVHWEPPNAHNGWLDMWLQLGLVGLIPCVVGVLLALARAIAWARHCKTPEGLWPGIFMVYVVLANLTETSFMVQNDIFWVLYVAIVLSLSMPFEDQSRLFPEPENSS